MQWTVGSDGGTFGRVRAGAWPGEHRANLSNEGSLAPVGSGCNRRALQSIGVFDFVLSRIQGPAYMASAGMTPEQIAYYQQLPAWMMFVWALGVFSACAASLLLLLRRKSAAPVFALSLAAFLVSLLNTYVLTNGGAVMGQQMAITSAVIAVLLLLFSM